jgi:hypothetical protein
MEKHLTPLKAIREKCIECAGSIKEVKLCQDVNCALFPYRLGRNPARKGIGGRRSPIFPLKLKLEYGKSLPEQEIGSTLSQTIQIQERAYG